MAVTSVGATAPARPGVAAALVAARHRITTAAERSGRDPAAVTIVAVTKTVPVERIREAIDAGVTDVGENRVQEAAAKRAILGDAARWHLIGHLQTNKAGRAAALFEVVHSVDGLRVAEALASRRPAPAGVLDVLLEVELTGQPARTGFGPGDLTAALPAIAAVPCLRVRGLMTVAPFGFDAESARPTFAAVRRLRDDLQQRTGLPLPELSMGMSRDHVVAVEEGATIVRLGRALFGERPRTPAR